MGLAFDFRVMSSDRGYFFIPGVDLGLVYAPLQIALMKDKLPPSMHREVIVYNMKRWNASELLTTGEVDVAAPAAEVQTRAIELASKLKAKGQGAARKAMGGIKRELYRDVVEALHENAVAAPMTMTVAAPVSYAAAPMTQVPSYVAPPVQQVSAGPPANLTDGIPNPAAIQAQKEGYAKALE